VTDRLNVFNHQTPAHPTTIRLNELSGFLLAQSHQPMVINKGTYIFSTANQNEGNDIAPYLFKILSDMIQKGEAGFRIINENGIQRTVIYDTSQKQTEDNIIIDYDSKKINIHRELKINLDENGNLISLHPYTLAAAQFAWDSIFHITEMPPEAAAVYERIIDMRATLSGKSREQFLANIPSMLNENGEAQGGSPATITSIVQEANSQLCEALLKDKNIAPDQIDLYRRAVNDYVSEKASTSDLGKNIVSSANILINLRSSPQTWQNIVDVYVAKARNNLDSEQNIDENIKIPAPNESFLKNII
jgi:hypothetical protein